MPRSLWLSRDWAKMRSLASSMAWRRRRANAVALQRLGGLQGAGDGLDRHLRGHLAGGRARPCRRTPGTGRPWGPAAMVSGSLGSFTPDRLRDVRDEEVVLVVLADEADVGLAERGDPDVRRVIHALEARRKARRLSYLEAQQLVADSDQIPGGQQVLVPQPDEGAVRAAQVHQRDAVAPECRPARAGATGTRRRRTRCRPARGPGSPRPGSGGRCRGWCRPRSAAAGAPRGA